MDVRHIAACVRSASLLGLLLAGCATVADSPAPLASQDTDPQTLRCIEVAVQCREWRRAEALLVHAVLIAHDPVRRACLAQRLAAMRARLADEAQQARAGCGAGGEFDEWAGRLLAAQRMADVDHGHGAVPAEAATPLPGGDGAHVLADSASRRR